MRDMAASSGVAHVGAPAQQPAAPRIAGIVKPERPASVGVSGLADPDQASAEHSQDAAAGLGAARMVACVVGATVENMIEARRRIPSLLRVPARVHWLSVAPLLEPLDLRPWPDVLSIGSLSAARLVPEMPATWSLIGRVICAISAMTRAPRSFSTRCGSGKRSLPT